MTDIKGTIHEASRSVFEAFNLPVSTFNSGEVQIDDLFAFSYEHEETMATEGMRLPLDIQAIAQRLNPENDKSATRGKFDEEEESLCLLTSGAMQMTAVVHLKRS